MSVIRPILWLALACLCVSSASAEPDVVPGQAPVSDRGNATRAEALPQALADALRRLSPEPDPAATPAVQSALSSAEDWLQRFEYQQRIRPTASGIPSIRLMLHTWFHAAPLRELLVQAGVPVWRGGSVPVTFWLVDESADGRGLIEGASDPRLADFRQALEQRGIRAGWALNDLNDLRMAETLDAGSVAGQLAERAADHGVPAAVLVRLRSGEDGVSADWHLHEESGSRRITSQGDEPESALLSGVPDLVSALAGSQAVRPSAAAASAGDRDHGPGEYVVWVDDLGRAGSYAAAIAALDSQSPVVGLTPEQASGARARLRLRLDAPLGRLLALLAVDGRWEVVEETPEDADLVLRWRG